MTRKDYELIAEVLRTEYERAVDRNGGLRAVGAAQAVRFVTHRMADALAKNNPRFDRDKFVNVALGEER